MTSTNDPSAGQGKIAAVTALQAAFGAPSQAGFGSAVFYDPTDAGVSLEQAALAKYRYFVGDLWQRYGESAWMGSWRAIYSRPAGATHDIVAELRSITDHSGRMSVEMILDNVEEAGPARAALSAVYDDPAMTDLAVYSIGDGAALSGLVVAGRHVLAVDDTILVFLLD